MLKILVSDKLAQEGLDLLEGQADVELTVKTGLSEEELIGIIGEFDGLIIRSGTKVTAKVVAAAGKLRAIARAGVGVDNVDLAAATAAEIIVMNTPGGNTISAAEHTLALMMALSRHVVQGNNSLKAGRWDRKLFMGTQLRGKTLGVLGLGRIGMAVARRTSIRPITGPRLAMPRSCRRSSLVACSLMPPGIAGCHTSGPGSRSTPMRWRRCARRKTSRSSLGVWSVSVRAT